MEATPIGLIVMPLSLFILFFKPRYLGCWAILLSPFQAASVLNVGGNFPIGVSPYFFVCVLIFVAFVPLWLSGRLAFASDDVSLRMVRPLFFLVLWAVVSAFLLPKLFAGVGVNTPRGGMDSPYTVPLVWTMSNAAQAGYVFLNFIFFLFVIWRSRGESEFRQLVQAFMGAGAVAATIGAYQFIAHCFGLPYPADFFNSNLAWRQLIGQQVAGVWRMSGTFSEPSAAGAFFAVWTTFFLLLATGVRSAKMWQWTMLLGGAAMLLLTASTTGYLTGAVVLALLGAWELRRAIVLRTVNIKALVCLIVIAGLLLCAALLFDDFGRLLSKLFFEKTASASGRDRMTTIREAFTITLQTWGMGVGLGSNRPSGMLFYLLSNIGVPGLLVFGYLLFATFASLGEAFRLAAPKPAGGFLMGAAWAFLAALLAMLAAGGDMVSPLLWVTWALLAAGIRATALDAIGGEGQPPIVLWEIVPVPLGVSGAGWK
jgi:hypothetical protein